MFDGKMKAVTFSYDDGITQDVRLIEMFNKYGLKATFNLNSERFGIAEGLVRKGITVAHVKPRAQEIRAIYEGHEVAAHTLTHPRLTLLDDNEIIRQVEQDRLNLSDIVGYEVVGMAYPCGGENHNAHVVDVIKQNTGIKYARTIISTNSFDVQKDLFTFKPTVHHDEFDKLFELAKKFVCMKSDKPQVFYIWGHSFEFDIDNSWGKMEEFCKIISGHNDIFYGTNKEILL